MKHIITALLALTLATAAAAAPKTYVVVQIADTTGQTVDYQTAEYASASQKQQIRKDADATAKKLGGRVVERSVNVTTDAQGATHTEIVDAVVVQADTTKTAVSLSRADWLKVLILLGPIHGAEPERITAAIKAQLGLT